MSDYKSAYSEASQYYVKAKVPSSEVDRRRYDASKRRETQFNESWKKHAVNINEICDRFVPDDDGHKGEKLNGVKYVFEGERYKVKADMASGYLRIYDKALKKYVKLDGSAGTRDDTHFKILRREEM